MKPGAEYGSRDFDQYKTKCTKKSKDGTPQQIASLLGVRCEDLLRVNQDRLKDPDEDPRTRLFPQGLRRLSKLRTDTWLLQPQPVLGVRGRTVAFKREKHKFLVVEGAWDHQRACR